MAKPDPDGQNADRAEWAASALRHFQITTGTDYDDALADLLCDLMHWCDREPASFDEQLRKARANYAAETTSPEPTPGAGCRFNPGALCTGTGRCVWRDGQACSTR